MFTNKYTQSRVVGSMKCAAGIEQAGINVSAGAAVAGIVQPGVLPLTAAHTVFYKYPGGFPVVGFGGGAPGVFPCEVKLHQRVVGGMVYPRGSVLPGYQYVGNFDVVGAQATQQQPQRDEDCKLFSFDRIRV